MTIQSIGAPEGGASFLVSWRLGAKRVLVVGGGPSAAMRVAPLLEADAIVTVVSRVVLPELEARAKRGEIVWHGRDAVPSDLEGMTLVFAAAEDEAANREVVSWARRSRIPAHVSDRPELCDFYVPSVHRDGPVQIAVGTGGAGPALAARLRREIAAALPPDVGRAVRSFGVLRQAIRASDPRPVGDPHRMRWLTDLARTLAWDRIAALDEAEIDTLVGRYLAGFDPDGDRSSAPRTRARVVLTGAGPGDPQLLTLAAKRALETADLVIADRLVPAAVHSLATGEVRIARKLPGSSGSAQDEIHRWIEKAVREGRTVVRLKAGDPFVFGRAGEEIAFVRSLGLEPEVIPGISAALAAPLAAGIPVTERGLADRFLVTTAVGRDGHAVDVPPFDESLTVVVLMGVGALDDLSQALRDAGWPDSWPAAAISSAWQPGQRIVRATVATLADAAHTGEIAAPATLVFGRTAADPTSVWAAVASGVGA